MKNMFKANFVSYHLLVGRKGQNHKIQRKRYKKI